MRCWGLKPPKGFAGSLIHELKLVAIDTVNCYAGNNRLSGNAPIGVTALQALKIVSPDKLTRPVVLSSASDSGYDFWSSVDGKCEC